MHILLYKLVFFGIEFGVLKNEYTTYADNDQVSLVIFGSNALFSEAKNYFFRKTLGKS